VSLQSRGDGDFRNLQRVRLLGPGTDSDESRLRNSSVAWLLSTIPTSCQAARAAEGCQLLVGSIIPIVTINDAATCHAAATITRTL
jgi:hypothetical protein